jgi:Tol biopolymer transport system component
MPVAVGTGRNVWLVDVARNVLTRFTFDEGGENRAIWSEDGSQIVFGSAQAANPQGRIFQKAASGADSEQPLLPAGGAGAVPQSWTSDGRYVLYLTTTAPAAATPDRTVPVVPDLWVLPLFGERKPFPLMSTPFTEQQAAFSPDGRWVAYVSNESGRNEVYVIPFTEPPASGGSSPGPDARAGKWQVSASGGVWPRWRHDGKELFFMTPDSKVMAAAVNGTASGFEVGLVQPLFQTRPRNGLGSFYAVSADGQRFLINSMPGVETTSPPSPITLVVNWMAGLKK